MPPAGSGARGSATSRTRRNSVDAFTGILEVLKPMPGHVESHLYEDVYSKGSFVIFSQWQKKEDFEAFIQSYAFRKTVTWGKEQILRGRPMHKVYLNQ